jgi:translocation protein SEC63
MVSRQAVFWKSVEATSGMGDIIKAFGSTFRYESQVKNAGDLSKVVAEVEKKAGEEWKVMSTAVGNDENTQRTLALLYAHFLRLDLGSNSLEQGKDPVRSALDVHLNARIRPNSVAPSNTHVT